MNDLQRDYFRDKNSIVYRFFEKESYADDFIRGKMRIGTFSSIIELPDNVRGDKGEGSIEYYSGRFHGDSDNPEIKYIARQMGMVLGEVEGLTIINCECGGFKDAYLMSLTHSYRPDDMKYFGEYCIEIMQPAKLVLLIGAKLAKNGGVKLLYDRVIYRDRLYVGTETLPTHPALIKPPTPEYLCQNETRAVWIPKNGGRLSPVFIDTGDIGQYCRRIN